jgi:class 3 adenylate cyclase
MYKTRVTMVLVLFACILLGSLYGLIFIEVAEALHAASLELAKLAREDVAGVLHALEPGLSRALTGVLLFGITAYLVTRSILALFARGLLSELVRLMRSKGYLPYTFEFNKKNSLRHTHENLIGLFETYVKKLHEAEGDKNRYQNAIEKYADPNVGLALKSKGTADTLRSGRKRVAVLFSDIRGFTPMTEALMPEEVVGVLNQHFAASTAAITRHGGKVNKFIGDAVMAIFEEPPSYREDASASRNALNAALEMQEKFEGNYEKWQGRLTHKVTFGLGVGVHCGTVIMGNIGSDERMEYTSIGDTVNLSARICSLAKTGEVLASEESFAEAGAGFICHAKEAVPIKGKTGLYTTYKVTHKGMLR